MLGSEVEEVKVMNEAAPFISWSESYVLFYVLVASSPYVLILQ